MWQPGSERGPIIEGIYGTALRELEAGLERVNLAPKFQYFFLLLGETKCC
jgi:hypothetical protein